MASLTHPSTSNYHHLPSLPRLKMNPLSNTNYSRSLAAIALANHSAALNQLSAPPPNCSSASACSSTTDFSGPAVAAPVGNGDARLSALLMRDGNDVSVTSSPLGSPNAAAWPQFGTVGGGGGAASLGGHLHHYFSPDLGSRPAATVLGFQGTSIETALKKLGECSRTSTTTADGCRDFNGMSHQQQQHSLSSVRSSAEATNIGTRFGGISPMGSSQHHPHQQQLNLHQLQMRENPAPAATATLRNDWATSIPCSSDPNLSFASSMASLGLQDPMRGGGGGGGASLSARTILLGGMCNNSRGQQQVDSYMLPGNVHGEVINEGSLSARMMRSMGDGGGSHQQQQQQGGDVSCLDLGDDAILQEMIGSYNAGNAVASSVMNAHLHALPSSPSSSHRPHHHHHHHHFPMQQQVGIEASLNSATDWASLLLDAGSPGHASNDQGGLRPKPVGMGAAPRGPHFTSESGFAERTAKMLFHAAAEGQQQQIQGDILGPASGSLHHHLTATTFMDCAGGINFGGSPGAFGATLLTSNSTRTRLEVDGSKSSSPGRLAGIASTDDNLSEPSRMWRPPSSSEAAAAGKQPVVGGLMRTLSANSRGSVEMGVVVERHNSAREMLDSLCERKDALELELEQCSSMSAMLDDLPPPPTAAAAAAAADKRGGFPKSERKLSRTSSPSVSTMVDLASMEPGTSSACNSVSEPTDDKKVDAPAREDPSGPGTGKGKALLSDIAEAGGENSSSGKEECKENSGTESQGKKRKDRAAEEKLPAKTSATSSRTIPVKDTKQEDAEVPNRSKRSRGSTSEPDSVRAKFGDTRSKSGSDNSGDSAKPPEAPKPDYIHVRARRGQATDSHSLAERVRREKISERMKYLQDLVPGCSKVTGKAMMLDEIINYVQSLQRQVEFLSMKLQSVNPRMDFSMESLLSTEHSRGFPQGGQQQLMIGSEAITIPSAAYPQLHPQQQAIAMQQLAVTCGLDMRSLGTQLDTVAGSLRRSLVSPASGSSITMAHSARDPFDESVSQVSTVWDGELHSVVQMGYAQNRLSSLASPGLRGSLPPGNMKMER